MVWQDVTITTATSIASIALIPQVYRGYKTKNGPILYETSVPTFSGMFVLSYVYFTLDLVLSSAVSFLTASLWLILFIQRRIYHKAY